MTIANIFFLLKTLSLDFDILISSLPHLICKHRNKVTTLYSSCRETTIADVSLDGHQLPDGDSSWYVQKNLHFFLLLFQLVL